MPIAIHAIMCCEIEEVQGQTDVYWLHKMTVIVRRSSLYNGRIQNNTYHDQRSSDNSSLEFAIYVKRSAQRRTLPGKNAKPGRGKFSVQGFRVQGCESNGCLWPSNYRKEFVKIWGPRFFLHCRITPETFWPLQSCRKTAAGSINEHTRTRYAKIVSVNMYFTELGLS